VNKHEASARFHRGKLPRVLGTLIAILILAALQAVPGQAATTTPAPTDPGAAASDSLYTYWSMWTGGTDWKYSELGGAQTTPADGTSIGWRWGVGPNAGITELPRAAPNFDAACASTLAAAGHKRVAVVIDSGTPAEAPSGSTPPATTTGCASVPTNANGLQVVGAVSSLRQNSSGMVCGIGGYPASGCGGPITLAQVTSDASASAAPSTTSDSSAWLPFVAGITILMFLVVIIMLVMRLRKAKES
jgi:hypothetical protein